MNYRLLITRQGKMQLDQYDIIASLQVCFPEGCEPVPEDIRHNRISRERAAVLHDSVSFKFTTPLPFANWKRYFAESILEAACAYESDARQVEVFLRAENKENKGTRTVFVLKHENPSVK